MFHGGKGEDRSYIEWSSNLHKKENWFCIIMRQIKAAIIDQKRRVKLAI
jgi:hypothetical protein